MARKSSKPELREVALSAVEIEARRAELGGLYAERQTDALGRVVATGREPRAADDRQLPLFAATPMPPPAHEPGPPPSEPPPPPVASEDAYSAAYERAAEPPGDGDPGSVGGDPEPCHQGADAPAPPQHAPAERLPDGITVVVTAADYDRATDDNARAEAMLWSGDLEIVWTEDLNGDWVSEPLAGKDLARVREALRAAGVGWREIAPATVREVPALPAPEAARPAACEVPTEEAGPEAKPAKRAKRRAAKAAAPAGAPEPAASEPPSVPRVDDPDEIARVHRAEHVIALRLPSGGWTHWHSGDVLGAASKRWRAAKRRANELGEGAGARWYRNGMAGEHFDAQPPVPKRARRPQTAELAFGGAT